VGRLPLIGTSVLAALGPVSGTDMPLLPAIRSLNMTYTRELRGRAFQRAAHRK